MTGNEGQQPDRGQMADDSAMVKGGLISLVIGTLYILVEALA